MHPVESVGEIEACRRLESEQRAPPLGHPHIAAGDIPHPHGQVACFRGETHQVRALTQRFFRASFLFDDDREQHQRSSCHQEEQLQCRRVLDRGLGQERPVAAHDSPDRLERDDQHRDADSTEAEAERRPDQQRNRRIQECWRRVGTCGRSIEYEKSHRHRTRADESRFEHASRGQGSRASDDQVVPTQKEYWHQDDSRDRIRDAQVAPFDPVVSAETVGNRKGSTPEGGPERHEHYGDEDEENRVTKRERLERRLDQSTDQGRCRDALHRVESLGGQCVQRRPVRLLGRQKMSAGGAE